MTLLPVFLVLFVCSVLGNNCPRTNRRPQTECTDECHPSKGCYKSNHDCLCDGDCGYSCAKKDLKCRSFRLRNGKVVGNGRNFNDTLKFICNDKHTLFGSLHARCRANGKWDSKRTRCKIACPDPGVSNFAKRNKKTSSKGFQEKTVLTFYCFPGYQMKSSSRIECQSSGKWSASPPVCEAKKCGRVKLPSNSEVIRPRNWKNTPTHRYGQRIILRCKSGYRKSGLGIMRCDGSWKILRKSFQCLSRSCGNPGTPRNGKKTGLAYTFKKIVRYSCDDCYNLDGVTYRQCQANGKWSDSLPSCKKIICADPGRIANGEVIISSKPMYCSTFVDFKCTIGYELKGASRRTCTSNKNWSNSQPKCEIVNCGNPGSPRNGRTISKNGFTYSQDITFDCYDGYVMEGSSLATCLANGHWSKDLPKCLEKCSDPRIGTNAVVVGKMFYHGKRVRFHCSKLNYVLVPPRPTELTCKDGTWNAKIPSCKAPCRSLNRIRLYHGRIRSTSSKHGYRTSFSCNAGYKLIGSGSSICNDGTWSHSVPKCSAICWKISSISNGWVRGNGNLEGNQVSFRCKQDYVLVGLEKLTCRSDRRWSASRPTCKAHCPRLRKPNNGNIKRQGFKHNEEVHFTCDNDYILGGQKVVTCSDGFWSEDSPRCFAPCNIFSNNELFHGYIKQQGFRHDESVTFNCHYPFVIHGESTLNCINGKWDKGMPLCGEPCSPLNPPINGKIIKNYTRHREETTFKCNAGYKLVGQSRHICNFGIWSGISPSCRAHCPRLRKPNNGNITRQGFKHNEEVHFTCDNDYILGGQKVVTCSDGFWSEDSPRCFAPCNIFSNNELFHGYIKQQGFRHDESVTFNCYYPFVIHGESTLNCINGKWDKGMPLCGEPCSPLNPPLNGKIIKNYTRHREETTFKCNAGYKLVGQSQHICNFGIWSGISPSCRALCKNISQFKNGKVIGSGNEEGDLLTFQCSRGYALIGPPSITCESNRQWNGSVPTCKALECPNSNYIRDGKVIGNGVSYGDKRNFTCKNKKFNKFNLVGAKEVTCLETGKWDKPWPKCVYDAKPVKDCGVVTGIKGGRAFRNETHHGGRVSFRCLNSSYTLVGKKNMRCVSGIWIKKKPKCLASCKAIRAPQNGNVNVRTKHDSKIDFKCNKGYSLKGEGRLTCDDGVWDHLPPTCVKQS